MNRRVSPLLNKLEEARIAKNCDLDEIGSLRKDKGYSLSLNQPTADNVLSLFAFYSIASTTTRYLLRDSGGNVYQANFGGGTWDAITGATGLSVTVTPAWITYKNLAMRFNGTDTPKKYDGTTFANLGGSPPNGTIPALFKDKVYVAGVSPNFSTMYFSSTGNPENWPTFNNFDVNNNDGDRIMAVFPVFDSLIIWKEFSIWEFQVDSKNNPSVLRYLTLDVGTTARRSVINIGGVVYFFNRRGIYQLAWRYPELISLKVQDFIDAVTDPYGVVAFRDGNKYCLYIGDVTVDGKSYPKCVLVYDTLQDTWKIRTLAHAITAVSDFIDSNNSLSVYLGSTAGKSLKWKQGYDYAGIPIEMEYETGIIELGDPLTEKTLEKFLLRTSNKAKSPPTLHVSVDNERFKELGTVRDPVTEFQDRFRGRDIRLRFHEVSNKEMKEIYKVGMYFDETKGGELTKGRNAA
jgi:hypothetical protein